jgi:polyisoprenoid-binding protein YceI
VAGAGSAAGVLLVQFGFEQVHGFEEGFLLGGGELVQDGTLTGSWTLDPARSQVLLETRHTWGLLPLHGVFRQVTANATVTAAGQVTGTLTVAAASIDTSNKMRDKDLRSAKVFDTASHPDITYTAEGVHPAGGGTRVTGSLTVRGRTRPLSFDAKVSATADEVRLDAGRPDATARRAEPVDPYDGMRRRDVRLR